jgi:hypothetical protein
MLTGQAKKDYQREYMRRRRSNTAKLVRPVRPIEIPGLRIDGNKILGLDRISSPTMPDQPSNVAPLYDSTIHGPGDRVRVLQGKKFIEVTVPEIDADGHPIGEW